MLKLKSYFGKENSVSEHKEFTLNHDVLANHTNDSVSSYINGVYDDELHNMILKSLTCYIHEYLPKYVATFMNAKTLDKNNHARCATLNIGITDTGYISGIPLYSKTSLEYYNKMINNNISCAIINNIRYSNIDDIISNVSFKLIPLCYDYLTSETNNIQTIINDTKKIHKNFVDNKKKYDEEMGKYNKKIEAWQTNNLKYSKKLTEILNDSVIRHQYIKYMLKHHRSDLTPSEGLDIDKVYSYIRDINDFNKVCINTNKIPDKPENDHENPTEKVYINVNEKQEYVVILYNVFKTTMRLFRNIMQDKVARNKPVKPYKKINMTKINKRKNQPYMLSPNIFMLRRLTSLIDVFVMNNDVKYYVLEIVIKLEHTNKELVGYVKDNKILYKTRKCVERSPISDFI